MVQRIEAPDKPVRMSMLLEESFTAKFHDRLYLVTADHVVSDQSAQNLRVFDPVTAHSLLFKKFHPLNRPKTETI
jgi:hypothetical protein